MAKPETLMNPIKILPCFGTDVPRRPVENRSNFVLILNKISGLTVVKYQVDLFTKTKRL